MKPKEVNWPSPDELKQALLDVEKEHADSMKQADDDIDSYSLQSYVSSSYSYTDGDD